jgi:hypothetical protein
MVSSSNRFDAIVDSVLWICAFGVM